MKYDKQTIKDVLIITGFSISIVIGILAWARACSSPAPTEPPVVSDTIKVYVDSVKATIDTVEVVKELIRIIYVEEVEKFNAISLDSNLELFKLYCQRYIDSNQPSILPSCEQDICGKGLSGTEGFAFPNTDK